MSSNELMIQIERALASVKLVRLSGVLTGDVYVTPSQVVRTVGVGLVPHWEFQIDPQIGARQLAPWNHGIFLGGIAFPDACPVCGQQSTRFELAEVGVRRGDWPSRTGFSNTTQDEVNRIVQAATDTRFWFAVPFCNTHGIRSKGVHLESSLSASDPVVVEIRHHEWGLRFAALNDLAGGTWVTWPTLSKRITLAVAGWLLVIAGSLLLAAGGQGTKHGMTELIALVTLVVGLVLFLTGGALVLKAERLGLPSRKRKL